METSEIVKECSKRLLLSRMRVIMKNPFFGLLLMHVTFGIDDTNETAYTDGERICFCAEFMKNLSDSELDFVLMHEVMHIALRHCERGKELDNRMYNIACDIVVNSNILQATGGDVKNITLKEYGEAMHLTPTGTEGYDFTAEEVYAMLNKKNGRAGNSEQEQDGGSGENGSSGVGGDDNYKKGNKSSSKKKGGEKKENNDSFDNHEKWKRASGDDATFDDDVWIKRIRDAAAAAKNSAREKDCGNVPKCVQRLLNEANAPQIDWRTLLNNFLSEEVNDYSFSPPDRRYDGDFFLPDFNGTDIAVKDILFMIDTSQSMADDEILEMYSEVKGAIDQYGGRLSGYLGFFDCEVVEPKPFVSESEFSLIKAYGGGGTSFNNVFNYVKENMLYNMPAALIMLTDGYAPFPPKNKLPDVPLLWVIDNEDVKPPYGKTIRVKRNPKHGF